MDFAVICVLTWPAFGTWLVGPAHGRIESCRDTEFVLPEPDEILSIERRRGLKWPVIQLDAHQREIVRLDLHRMAEFRPLVVHDTVILSNHAHALLTLNIADDQDAHHLIQLIKGATARALSVASGDRLPISTAGERLAHHKWWTRQYVMQRLQESASADRARMLLAQHFPDSVK